MSKQVACQSPLLTTWARIAKLSNENDKFEDKEVWLKKMAPRRLASMIRIHGATVANSVSANRKMLRKHLGISQARSLVERKST